MKKQAPHATQMQAKAPELNKKFRSYDATDGCESKEREKAFQIALKRCFKNYYLFNLRTKRKRAEKQKRHRQR